MSTYRKADDAAQAAGSAAYDREYKRTIQAGLDDDDAHARAQDESEMAYDRTFDRVINEGMDMC